MILGVISDTHGDPNNALPHIMAQFKKRKVNLIIHCGDIEKKDICEIASHELPVICALTEAQVEKKPFQTRPADWDFTFPNDRVRAIEEGIRIYVGHKRSFEFLTGSESQLMETMQELSMDYDCLRWLFSGHTHHQIFAQTRLTNFINPGAVASSYDGHEFAIVNTGNNEVVFSRIMASKPAIPTFSVGVISDSANISKLDPLFWQKLAEEFKERDVSWIIHCGNISPDDIGRPELADFTVYYNLHPKQKRDKTAEKWHLINLDPDDPVIEIEGYRFWVWYSLGADLLEQSELDMHRLCLQLMKKYPDLTFLLCGMTHNAFLEEGEQIRIVNPGDIIKDRNFAVICLPRTEITFGHVPLEPLPLFKKE